MGTREVETIQKLADMIDNLPTCKIASDEVLLVHVDKYNELVNTLNEYFHPADKKEYKNATDSCS